MTAAVGVGGLVRGALLALALGVLVVLPDHGPAGSLPPRAPQHGAGPVPSVQARPLVATRQATWAAWPVMTWRAAGVEKARRIPDVARSAYEHADRVLDLALPTCGLDWQLLAGVGAVVSDHGRRGRRGEGGAHDLAPDGTTTPRLLGVRRGPDTDAGAWDRDTVGDRTLGPLQLSPAVWEEVAVDGDGDGRRDPHDVDDAALGLAVVLCSGPDDLATRAGRHAATATYSRDGEVLHAVLTARRSYLRRPGLTGALAAPVLLGPLPDRPTSTPTARPSTAPPTPRPTSTPTPTPSTRPSPSPSPSPSPGPTVLPVTTPTPSASPTDTDSAPTSEPSTTTSPGVAADASGCPDPSRDPGAAPTSVTLPPVPSDLPAGPSTAADVVDLLDVTGAEPTYPVPSVPPTSCVQMSAAPSHPPGGPVWLVPPATTSGVVVSRRPSALDQSHG